MAGDLAAAGTVVVSLLGLIGVVRTRWRATSPIPHGNRMGLVHLAETYVKGLGDVTLEGERRATIVAVLAALPPGGVVAYQQPNGTKVTIRIPSTMSPAWPKGTEPSEHRNHAGP